MSSARAAVFAAAAAAGLAVVVCRALRRKRRLRKLHVHLVLPKVLTNAALVDKLRTSLDPVITLTTGKEVSPAAEVLVATNPTDAHLSASQDLKAVVLPYAGPLIHIVSHIEKTYPHLSIHSLHFNAVPTAEFAMSLLLAAAKQIVPADRQLRQNDWTPCGSMCLMKADETHPSMHQVILEGKDALIVGLGAIGIKVAQACLGLGMRVKGVRNSVRAARSVVATPFGSVDVYPSSALHDLLPTATALIVCVPLTAQTRGLIGARELALLPKDAVVVNVARGAVVDEEALYNALKDRKIHGAGLDVWYNYPTTDFHHPPSAFDFASLDNVVMSPHRGGAAGIEDSEERRMIALAEVLNAVVEAGSLDRLANRMSTARGY